MPTYTVKIIAEFEITDINASTPNGAISKAYKNLDDQLNKFYVAEIANYMNETVVEQVD
jgi:hypothetical protein